MSIGWRAPVALAAVLLSSATLPVRAQDRPITDELLAQLVEALRAEDAELEKAGPKLQEIDEKIKKFEECRQVMLAAGEISDSRSLGLAAKAAMKVKCGATNTDGFLKDKQKVLEGPEKAALAIMKMKKGDYGQLKERVGGYLGGTRTGFADGELAALDKYKGDLSSLMRIRLAAAQPRGDAGGGGRTGRGGRNYNFSSPNYAWEYIGNMFQVMYLSGAMAFEKPYQPGQWTKWQLTREFEVTGNEPTESEKAEFERAFLGKSEDGGEWWRTTQIDYYDDGGKQVADTVVLEGLFKGENEYVRQLVRMRGRFPGQPEPQELMVPQAFAMLSLLSAFPFKPTEESIKGATVGNEKVAGFDARHVKFGGTDGSLEWWIADNAPGGWVRFKHTDTASPDVKKPASYVMEMVQQGTGAKSQLGVMK